MNIKYIAIEREYGSGGTEIGKKLSEKCGIPCYGPEILEIVARKQGVSLDALQSYEENVSQSVLYSMFVVSQSQTGNPDLLSPEAKLFVEESRVIKDLSENGPAIFVGHCASHVLSVENCVLRVFIRASESYKMERIINQYSISEKEAASVCRRFNRKRSNYYSFCTQRKWNDLNNYDLILDSSTLGIDECVTILSTQLIAGQ